MSVLQGLQNAVFIGFVAVIAIGVFVIWFSMQPSETKGKVAVVIAVLILLAWIYFSYGPLPISLITAAALAVVIALITYQLAGGDDYVDRVFYVTGSILVTLVALLIWNSWPPPFWTVLCILSLIIVLPLIAGLLGRRQAKLENARSEAQARHKARQDEANMIASEERRAKQQEMALNAKRHEDRLTREREERKAKERDEARRIKEKLELERSLESKRQTQVAIDEEMAVRESIKKDAESGASVHQLQGAFLHSLFVLSDGSARTGVDLTQIAAHMTISPADALRCARSLAERDLIYVYAAMNRDVWSNQQITFKKKGLEQVADSLNVNQNTTDEILRVLYITSNPKLDLRTEAEVRLVQNQLRTTPYRDVVRVSPLPAATPEDLIDGLNNIRPHIVHFSGHSGNGQVTFDNGLVDTPKGRSVSYANLARAFAATDSPPILVVLNGCDSFADAEGLLDPVMVVVGMRSEITDTAASIFATRFYSAIASGQSVASAVRQSALVMDFAGLEEGWKPDTHVINGLDLGKLTLIKTPF